MLRVLCECVCRFVFCWTTACCLFSLRRMARGLASASVDTSCSRTTVPALGDWVMSIAEFDVMWFHLVSSLLLVTTSVDAGCQFPSSLQTNRTNGPPRDWVGRVGGQFTEIGVHVSVAGNVIEVTASGSAHGRSYTVVCLQVRDHHHLHHQKIVKLLEKNSVLKKNTLTCDNVINHTHTGLY